VCLQAKKEEFKHSSWEEISETAVIFPKPQAKSELFGELTS